MGTKFSKGDLVCIPDTKYYGQVGEVLCGSIETVGVHWGICDVPGWDNLRYMFRASELDPITEELKKKHHERLERIDKRGDPGNSTRKAGKTVQQSTKPTSGQEKTGEKVAAKAKWGQRGGNDAYQRALRSGSR